MILALVRYNLGPDLQPDPLELLTVRAPVDKKYDMGMENVEGGNMSASGDGGAYLSPSTGAGDTPPSHTPLFACRQGPEKSNKAGRMGCPVCRRDVVDPCFEDSLQSFNSHSC